MTFRIIRRAEYIDEFDQFCYAAEIETPHGLIWWDYFLCFSEYRDQFEWDVNVYVSGNLYLYYDASEIYDELQDLVVNEWDLYIDGQYMLDYRVGDSDYPWDNIYLIRIEKDMDTQYLDAVKNALDNGN